MIENVEAFGIGKDKTGRPFELLDNIMNHEKRYLDRVGREGVLDACAYTPEWWEAVSSVFEQILAGRNTQI